LSKVEEKLNIVHVIHVGGRIMYATTLGDSFMIAPMCLD